jgi:hypothetical protein
MAKYIVQFTHVCYELAEKLIEAGSEDQAWEKAEEMIDDGSIQEVEFKATDGQFQVASVQLKAGVKARRV